MADSDRVARRKQGPARRDPNDEPLPRFRQAWRWFVHDRWIAAGAFVVLFFAAGFSSSAVGLRFSLSFGVLLVILSRRTPKANVSEDITP